MTEKTIFFTSGMPRSGSTLLQAILDQNPDFHAWVTSGMLEATLGIRNTWDKFLEHQAVDEEVSRTKKKNALRAIIDSYYADVSEPYVFDKCRGWVAHIEMLEWVLDRKVKILAPVRDLREILASMELLWRNASKEGQISQEYANYVQMQTVQGRCNMWMDQGQLVGISYNRLGDVIKRGYRDRIHFVHHEHLTSHPEITMAGIYDFLELPKFEHDFQNVIKKYEENDRVYGFPNLHKIRPVVTPTVPKADGILGGDVAAKYKGPYPWS